MLETFENIKIGGLAELSRLRAEVRAFVQAEGVRQTPEGWDCHDPEFTRKVAARGWIGMTWPKAYGGQERSTLERYIVTEELLAAGAPVRAHWVADRQIGPLLLAAGSEAQKAEFLPRIVAGECFFCIGLSEPNSGSDLASIRTKATKVKGGWQIDGAKVWTSYAHRADYMNLFARSAPFDIGNRHAGVSQFLVDLRLPGITINPIHNLAGDHDFNEVIFDAVFLPDAMLLGREGGAWSQVSGELAHERSGPERWLGAYGALTALLDAVDEGIGEGDGEKIGRLVARLWALHRMSFSIAVALGGEHQDLATEAALVKDLGTELDQAVPEAVRDVMPSAKRAGLADDGHLDAMLRRAVLYAPSYSIRGGTREILRGVIARGLGLR